MEADYRASTHKLYRDIVTSGTIFGAERWISTLKQMCERAVLSNEVLADNILGDFCSLIRLISMSILNGF